MHWASSEFYCINYGMRWTSQPKEQCCHQLTTEILQILCTTNLLFVIDSNKTGFIPPLVFFLCSRCWGGHPQFGTRRWNPGILDRNPYSSSHPFLTLLMKNLHAGETPVWRTDEEHVVDEEGKVEAVPVPVCPLDFVPYPFLGCIGVHAGWRVLALQCCRLDGEAEDGQDLRMIKWWYDFKREFLMRSTISVPW